VSWAPFERTRLYLSRRLLLVRAGRGDVREIRIEPEMRAEEMLAQATAGLAPGARLAIHLSAGLCPPVAVDYPAGLRSFAERKAFAAAAAATALGAGPGEIVAEIDAARPQTVAALPASFWNDLGEWSGKSGYRLESVAPLWSVATSCAVGRRSSAFALQEPDAVTVFSCRDGSSAHVLSTSIGDGSHAPAHLRRMRQALSVDSTAICMEFGNRSSAPLPDMPRAWHAYWSKQ
jgi:hypothetical protein